MLVKENLPAGNDKLKLAGGLTVADYQRLRAERNKIALVEFLHKRLHERYFVPLTKTNPKYLNSFATMATCCLTIEILEAYYNGWVDTRTKSKRAFVNFFKRVEPFALFRGFEEEFYTNVRCAIYFQGETSKGWKVRRKGELFDPQNKIINAAKFLTLLNEALDNYCKELLNADWNTRLWKNFILKMDKTCANYVADIPPSLEG